MLSLLKGNSFGLVTLVVVFTVLNVAAQDDLLKELEQAETKSKEYTFASFKGTRAVNGHSVETKGGGELEFIIAHRFGRLNTGVQNFWGLDEAFIRIGFEYGITDRLGVGVGRNSDNKIYDGYLKYKVIRQSSGPGSIPFTVTAFASTGIQTIDPTLDFANKITYTYQLLFARKFSPKFSFQIAPTVVHSNQVDQYILNNDQYALGIAGRYKLTRSLSLNAEYYYRFDPNPTHRTIIPLE